VSTPVQTIPCYRNGCPNDSGHIIQLKSGLVRYVCFDHLHDFALEAPSDMPEDFHRRVYAKWRHDYGLEPMNDEDLNAIVALTRRDLGYKFETWEY
jgi:hypothetical protein